MVRFLSATAPARRALVIVAALCASNGQALAQSAEPEPAPDALPEDALGGSTGEAPTPAPAPAPAPGGTNASDEASRRAMVDKVIRVCREKPDHEVCVKLRGECERRRGDWKGDMLRLCPVVTGGEGGGGGGMGGIGESGGGSGGGSSGESKVDQLRRVCQENPNQSGCAKLRNACLSNWDRLKPQGRALCSRLGFAPKPEPPMAWFGALAATYLKYGDSASVKGNSGAFGGQISGRAFSQTGISATTFDFVIGSVDTGWHWDLNAMWGLGGWSGRRFAVGVTGGLRYAGLGGGGMPFALGVPAELAVQVAVRPNLVVLGYARPIWNLGKDNSRRKKGSTIGVFADELQLGAQVALAKLQRASSAGSGGLVAGLTYHEWAKTRFFGVSLGYGQVSHD